jgi:hypothetical protein
LRSALVGLTGQDFAVPGVHDHLVQRAVVGSHLDLVDDEAVLAFELYLAHLAGDRVQRGSLGCGAVDPGEPIEVLVLRLVLGGLVCLVLVCFILGGFVLLAAARRGGYAAPLMNSSPCWAAIATPPAPRVRMTAAPPMISFLLSTVSPSWSASWRRPRCRRRLRTRSEITGSRGCVVNDAYDAPEPSGDVPAFSASTSLTFSMSRSSSRLPGPPETPRTSTGPTPLA